jgi:BASS family bile acid:Na+ symporter
MEIVFIVFLVGLSVLASRSVMLKRISFTLWILTIASAAFLFPEYFTAIGPYQTKSLIIPLLMVIMFGMGTSMSIQDFWRVVKMPKGVLVGISCQFTIMPLVGYVIIKIFQFPPEIAAGIILVGCSPSGLASNVMAYIAKANLALSLTLTAVATMLAPLITPFIMKVLANQLVPIDFVAMMNSILKIVIAPVIAGLVFNHLLKEKGRWLKNLMPRISMVGIAVVIAVIIAAGKDNLVAIGGALIVACLLHNCIGYVLGYYLAKAFKMNEASCRTIAIEVGMQNSGLASGIALEMGKITTMGLAPIVFGPLMNITGSGLASYWQYKKIEEQ